MPSAKRFNIVIVDDSTFFREVIESALSDFEEVNILEKFSTGSQAIDYLINHGDEVDLVFLDVYLSDMTGLDVLEKVKGTKADQPEFLLMTGASNESSKLTVKGLIAGAFDLILKPNECCSEKSKEDLQSNLSRVLKSLNKNDEVRPPQTDSDSNKNIRNIYPDFVCPDICVIISSTGGPQALATLLAYVNCHMQFPTLIVQHIPENFSSPLVLSLKSNSIQKVEEVSNNSFLRPERVYVAPGGAHTAIRYKSSTRELFAYKKEGARVNNCRPCADVTLKCLAQYEGLKICTITLTGMGSDGLEGINELKTSNNQVFSITQAANECTVYGMPKAINEANLSDAQLSLNEIGDYLRYTSSLNVFSMNK